MKFDTSTIDTWLPQFKTHCGINKKQLQTLLAAMPDDLEIDGLLNKCIVANKRAQIQFVEVWQFAMISHHSAWIDSILSNMNFTGDSHLNPAHYTALSGYLPALQAVLKRFPHLTSTKDLNVFAAKSLNEKCLHWVLQAFPHLRSQLVHAQYREFYEKVKAAVECDELEKVVYQPGDEWVDALIKIKKYKDKNISCANDIFNVAVVFKVVELARLLCTVPKVGVDRANFKFLEFLANENIHLEKNILNGMDLNKDACNKIIGTFYFVLGHYYQLISQNKKAFAHYYEAAQLGNVVSDNIIRLAARQDENRYYGYLYVGLLQKDAHFLSTAGVVNPIEFTDFVENNLANNTIDYRERFTLIHCAFKNEKGKLFDYLTTVIREFLMTQHSTEQIMQCALQLKKTMYPNYFISFTLNTAADETISQPMRNALLKVAKEMKPNLQAMPSELLARYQEKFTTPQSAANLNIYGPLKNDKTHENTDQRKNHLRSFSQ